MAEKDAATVLEEAADLLLIRGRCRHVAMDQHGRYCVVGAVMAARGRPMVPGLVMQQFEPDERVTDQGYNDPAIVALGDSMEHHPAIWNDETRDDFEVIDTLRHVAKSIRNGEPS